MTQELLQSIAGSTREIFLRVLDTSLGHTQTGGTCFYAALLLANAVNRFTAYKARVRGGDGEGDGGFRDRQGVWHGHYWCEAVDQGTSECWVLCITSDQFGEDPVRVLPRAEARRQYLPGSQAVVDEHLASEAIAIMSAPQQG